VSDDRSSPFLGPSAFSGDWYPKASGATTGGLATYRGNIVFTNLDRGLVETILPREAGLSLAPRVQKSAAPESHPVLYLYGHPENTRWIIDNETVMQGESYRELMLVVPFVQRQGGPRWHNYVVRMYLNNGVAIWIGNKHYGYAKEFGTLYEKNVDLWTAELRTFDSDDVLMFHAQSKRTGSWRPSAQAKAEIPNYASIQTILAMPVVGRHETRGLICSYFELDDKHARVAPVESIHQFFHCFVPEMSDAWMELGRLSNVVNGAVAVQGLEWRINYPPLATCSF
jgi:hypothetical protein